jgi:crotonobetainyl-CoA:carnitine CoA-transferase CaiB-like acyl-CoA transferase
VQYLYLDAAMQKIFSNLTVIELAGVLAGPSVGVFFAELGAKVIKIENPKTGGDITRSWKLPSEKKNKTSAYYSSVNAGKEIIFLDITEKKSLDKLYKLITKADVVITNFKAGDDKKLRVDYKSLSRINPKLIYASINGFGNKSERTAYDLILQAETGFMFMNGEKGSPPLKMPVALIDVLAGHQLKEAILIALLKRKDSKKGCHISVSLFESALASLVNQATNWLIGGEIPQAQGSLHPNICPYGELFLTKDKQLVTFAIGSDKQFNKLCTILDVASVGNMSDYSSNQKRVKNREKLYELMKVPVKKINFKQLYARCLEAEVPIGKIRNLKEVFELPEAQNMLAKVKIEGKKQTVVKSVSFKFLEHV